jgi:hypothetical protein
MKAFRVCINGQRLCTAGIGPCGVLSAIVSWVGGISGRAAPSDLRLSVGGLVVRTDEHVTWETPELKVGDTITVEIIEAEHVDPETERYGRDRSDKG